MASTQVYIKETVSDLDVGSIFSELMKLSTDKNSLYIRAKESMIEYFASDDCILSEREKAEMLTTLVSNMAIQMTSSSLASAISIAKENRDGPYQLTKLREDTLLTQEQRDKLASDVDLTDAQTDKIKADSDMTVIQGWKIQSDMIRDNGTIQANMPTTATTILPSTAIGESGLKWEQEQQTKMSVYATLAKSYRESGVVTWTTDPVSGKVNTITDAAPLTPGVTKAQYDIAVRQKTAFDDNKRQHAANSSANMIGLLLSAEESGNITADDVTKWRTAVDYLNTPTP